MKTSRSLLTVALALACWTAGAAAQEVPALAKAGDPAERQRVEQLIKGARQEGALEWVGVLIEPEPAEKILAEFKAYYGLPDLRTEYTYVGSAELVTRVEQLLRANRNNFDVVWTSAWAWYNDLLKRGELMQYNSPYYKEYTLSDKHGMSRDGYWVSDSYAFHPAYCPERLKGELKDFAPKSWKDFLDPRLKGLVSMGNALQSTSYVPTVQGIEIALGPKYLSDLAKTIKPVLFVKSAQGRDWCASGEFPVTLMSHAKDAAVLRNNHVDVRLVYPEEGIPMLPFAPVVLKRAPHPNVAKLFIDFVRSAHGAQTVMNAGVSMFFGRPGVTSPFPDLLPPLEAIKVIPMDWNVEGTEERIRATRQKFKDAGLGF